jgi:hypothetical protein
VISARLADPATQPVLIGAGNTSMEGALRGISSYCQKYQQDTQINPTGMKCVGVLITDGQPTLCDQTLDNLVTIARDSYSSAGKVTTYAVGMEGADFSFLGQLAQAAGAKDCDPASAPSATFNACNVGADTSAGVSTMTLQEALELVREYSTEFETTIETETAYEITKLDCEWSIPDAPQGQSFDKNKVNVEFSATGEDKDKTMFGYVESETACGDSNKAWRYDDASKPTRVVACPKTCEAIKAAPKGKIGILFGCEIIPLK